MVPEFLILESILIIILEVVMKIKMAIMMVALFACLFGAGCDRKNPARSAALAEDGKEPVILRVVDWSDSSKPRRDLFHAEFEERNPNIKIEYTMLTVDQFNNTVTALIKSGDGPDLFPVPVGMRLPVAVEAGWYQPLNSLVTTEFLDSFQDGSFVEGMQKIGDEIYVVPEKFGGPTSLFYYNKDILEEAGVSVPKTYSEFIDACRIITQKGAGRYYGLIEGGKQLQRLDTMARALCSTGGGRCGDANLAITLNGRAPYDTPQMIAAFDLLHQLQKDGSIHPDTMNISAPEARALFGEGQAAFICQGNWSIVTWAQNNPDLNYGVTMVPIPDTGMKGVLPLGDPGTWMGIYRQSKHPKEAATYLMALFSEDYSFEKSNVADGERISMIKGINEKYISNKISLDYYDIVMKNALTVPLATHRDSRVNDFYVEVKSISPSLGAIAQGVMAGSINDYAGALKTLADKTTAEWKRACEAVGLDFSVLEFPNWDPLKPYTDADYAALK
jgi:ABC-type glycerol-3-phosphate transport system substrate-binding protein